MMRNLLAIILWLACCVIAFGQTNQPMIGQCWGPASMAGPAVTLPRDLKWRQEHQGQAELWEGNQLLGAWLYEYKLFCPWDGEKWGRHTPRPPIEPPPQKVSQLPTGVDLEKIEQRQEVCTINGHKVTCQRAENLLKTQTAAGLTDDSQAVRVTIVSKEGSKRDALRKEIETGADFSPWREAIRLWSCAPEHWSMECGFPTATDGVIMQTADGAVGWRQEDLDPAKVLQGLRRILPNYDPKKDPGIADWLFPGIAELKEHAGLLLLGGLVLLAVITSKPPTA